MKIGAFARQFGIPVDTIRYYVDNGILLTEKINNQHVFDEKCVRDMELVLELKRMRFSILEIQKMLSFLRVTNLSDPQDELLFLEWLAKKQHLLEQEVASLQQAIGVITQKRGSFPRNQAQESRSLGIPLPCFSWFCCPDCGKSLALNHARVMHNQVFHGELECACGYGCTIEEGIVVAPSANRSTPGSLQTDNPRQEFVSNTDPLYVNFSQKPVEWFRKRLRPGGAKTQGILLEIGTGLGFFLATFLENLGENGWYIATDASLAFLQYNKKVLERSGKNPNVLFLAADVTRLPLRQRLVHYVVDYFGTTQFSWERGMLPLSKVVPLLRDGGEWLGSYFFVPEPYRFAAGHETRNTLFRLSTIEKMMGSLQVLSMRNLGETESLGEWENHLPPNGRMGLAVFHARKEAAPGTK